MAKKILFMVCLVFLFPGLVGAENWTRSSIEIKEKGWSENDGYKVYGKLVEPPSDNDNDCNASETMPDKALRFNVQHLRDLIGPDFDVNNIYVDGVTAGGEYALNVLQADNLHHGNGWQFRYLWRKDHPPKDWHQYNGYVYVCVGSTARALVQDSSFENIVLWYKNPNKTTYRNVDLCKDVGSNWFQKILGETQANLISGFCGNNNKANITFDFTNNTAVVTSNTPLKSDGSKRMDISFSQAGVTSEQVRNGLGYSHNGAWQTNPGESEGTYDNDPHTPSADVHIVHLKIRREDQSHFHTESGKALSPGESVVVFAEGRIENRSNDICDYVKMEYNVTTKKKFRHTEKKTLDDDVLDEDEREDDFQPGDKISKTMRRTTITLSNDMQAVTVATEGRNSYTFPITQKHLYEKKIPLYFWLDVKVRIDNSEDRDVSCNQGSDCDEYAKFEVLLPWFSSSFKADAVLGESSLAVAFENTSEASSGAISSYHWDFGDGETSDEENPIHVYEEAGTYTVSLTTTSTWGETRTSQQKIAVMAEPADEYPNPGSTNKGNLTGVIYLLLLSDD